MQFKSILLDEMSEERAIKRISHEIIERNNGVDNIALVGIVTRGVPFAKKVQANVLELEKVEVPCGSIDITLYRDDLTEVSEDPSVNGTEINFEVKDKDIILLDDVLFTGRTARAAIEAVLKLGRPRTIQLAVLIDRGHRELPIRADYVGKNVPTSLQEVISVRFKETDGEQNVALFGL